MSVDVTYTAFLSIRETLSATDNVAKSASATNRLVTHTLFNKSSTINASSSPAATLAATFEETLVDGAATIDLTDLIGTNDIAVDGSGLRVQALRFINKSTSDAVISIGEGESNGYDGFGSGFYLELPPNGNILVETQDGGTDISGTNKTLDLIGMYDDVAQISILLG